MTRNILAKWNNHFQLPPFASISISLVCVAALALALPTSFAQEGTDKAGDKGKSKGPTRTQVSDPADVLSSHAADAKAIIAEGLKGMQTFKKQDLGISMEYPSSFTFKDTAVAGAGLFGVSAMSGIVNVSWSSQKLDSQIGETLDAYTKSNKNSISAVNVPEYKFEKFVSDDQAKSNGLDQRRIVVEAVTPSPGGPITLRQKMYIIVDNGMGYVMCGTAPATFFSFTEPLFDKMGASFKKEAVAINKDAEAPQAKQAGADAVGKEAASPAK